MMKQSFALWSNTTLKSLCLGEAVKPSSLLQVASSVVSLLRALGGAGRQHGLYDKFSTN